MSRKVKISGYTKKVNYLGDISYRPFNTINNPLRRDALFTSGNFSVIGNVTPNYAKLYKGKSFSKYFTLQDLGVSVEEIKEIFSKDRLRLKHDPKDLRSYAYFGSLKEYMRVTLEHIIVNFPAAIVIRPFNKFGVYINGFDGDMVYLSNVENPYLINYEENGLEGDNPLRDLTKSFKSYVVTDGEYEAPVIDFTDMQSPNGFGLKVDGFENLNTTNTLYLRPNTKEIEKFFMNLNDLGSELLKRDVSPKYTYSFNRKYFVEELGYYVEGEFKGTWPTSDGYNLDFTDGNYDEYVTDLIEMCDEYDDETGNLIIRQLVTTSILEFDTIPSYEHDNNVDDGQKIKSLLSVYGRSFDNVKKYIDGIKFARTVTYDGVNNTSDDVLTTIATSFGWGMVDPISEFSVVDDLLERDGLTRNDIGYELTKEEVKKEIFKRLIINSPWLYKSKGTRKAIEFFNSFFSIPEGLISFNEYVYRAKNRITLHDLRDLYSEMSDLDLDAGEIQTVTDNGFPLVPNNSEEHYFQMAGRWHQETTGPNTDLEINDGNNPHMGPYDGGQSYWLPFKNLIPGFSPRNIVTKNEIVNAKNVYNETFEGYNIGENVNAKLHNISNQTNYGVLGLIKTTYPPKEEYDQCGCEVNNTTRTLDVSAGAIESNFECDYDLVEVTDKNVYQFYNNGFPITPTEECCKGIGGEFILDNATKGYICVGSDYVDCERYSFTSINEMGIEVYYDTRYSTYTTLVPSPECCSSESVGVQTNGGYNCIRKHSVIGKCIKLESVQSSSPLVQFQIEFENGVDGRGDIFNTNLSGDIRPLNIVIGYSTMFKLITDFGEMYISYQDIIDQTSPLVTNLSGNIVTFNIGLLTLTFNIGFIDCPVYEYDDVCVKGIDLTIVDNIGFTATPITLNISYTNSFNVTSIINESFSGNYYNIEDDHILVTSFDDNITLTLSNSLDTHSITFRVKDHISYAYAESGLNAMINLSINENISIRFKILVIDCVQCIDLDPVSEVLIDGKYYVVFSNGSITSNIVAYADCCPSNTTPMQTNGGYHCHLRDELPDDCVTAKSIVAEGNINSIPSHYESFDDVNALFDVVLGSNNSSVSNSEFTAPETGVYEISMSGYAHHQIMDSSAKMSSYELVDMYLYINDEKHDSAIFMLNPWNNSSNNLNTPAHRITQSIELNAGDKVEFKTPLVIPEGFYYENSRITNSTFTIERVEVICGCEMNLTTTHYSFSVGYTNIDYRPKYTSSVMTIDNGNGDVTTINIDLNNPASITGITRTLMIQNDSIITITNVDKLGEYNNKANLSYNGVVTITGGDLMSMPNEYLSLVFLTPNANRLVKFKFTPTECDERPLTFSFNDNNFVYQEQNNETHISNFVIKTTEEIILDIECTISGSNIIGGGMLGIQWGITDGQMFRYDDQNVLETTPLTTGYDTKSKSASGCNNITDIHIKRRYRWVIGPGTHNFTYDGGGTSAYCNGNTMSMCLQGEPNDPNTFGLYGFKNIMFSKVVDNESILTYTHDVSSITYCRNDGGDNGGF